jgi:putative flippase GtrA
MGGADRYDPLPVSSVRPQTNSTVVSTLQRLRRSPVPHHQAARFVISGGTVAVVYLGLGLLLSGPVGMPIQIAIPISYVLSVLLNYTLQRHFVFAHSTSFALSPGAQFVRYVQVGVVQYAFTALTTAVLPGPLGVSEQLVYVVSALIAAVLTFILLRFVVFHGA